MKKFAVEYDGDIVTGTPVTWQIWTEQQLRNAGEDHRILQAHEIVNARDCATGPEKSGTVPKEEIRVAQDRYMTASADLELARAALEALGVEIIRVEIQVD